MKKWTEEEQEAALKLCVNALETEKMGGGAIPATEFAIVGSTYITGEGVDIDCLFYVKHVDVDNIGFDGWLYGGSVGEGNESQWGSWKQGHVNMLVTSNLDYFRAWLTSAEVCRMLHLRGVPVLKQERVAIHNIIMDDSYAEAEVKRMSKWPGNVNDKP